jgi:putative transposase
MTNQPMRKSYPSDLTDAQWEILAPFIPEPGAGSPREPVSRREIVNGILYVRRTGGSWRQMPQDLPNGKTGYHSVRRWKRDGIWEKAMSSLRREVRTQMGRDPEPSAAIIDSQSITTSPVRGSERGFDAGKTIWGRTRSLLVETQGFLLAVSVPAANLTEMHSGGHGGNRGVVETHWEPLRRAVRASAGQRSAHQSRTRPQDRDDRCRMDR